MSTLFSGDIDPFSGDIDPFSGDVDPFSGAELDFTAAKALGITPASAFKVCILGATQAQNGCSGPWVDKSGTVHNAQPTQNGVDKTFYLAPYATWTTPSVGSVAQYIVARQAGTQITSLIQASKFPTGSARASWVDTTKLQNNQRYTYAVRAEFDDENAAPAEWRLELRNHQRRPAEVTKRSRNLTPEFRRRRCVS